MKQTTKTQPESIFDEIRDLERRCEEFIEKAVDKLKADTPGVPREVLKNIVTIRSGGSAFKAVLDMEGQL